ncbi:porin AaxA [Chlamydia psittaci CP3]|uniref:porin AaxA n=1 Tax=Chlamydia psittaci TaxID=83554 RepID=UPI00027E5CD0|nr:carbohydrate porin [Chlamydia psittaci]AFS27228.1 porin AaxA [Chlamydia psittaci CP3]KPZ36796.1 porin [Chlamydia psittaci CP3]
MASFRSSLLTALCTYGMMIMPAYAIDPNHPKLHHHKYSERLQKRHTEDSYVSSSSIQESSATSSQEPRRHVLTPIRNVLADRPCDEALSISKLFNSIEKETNSQISVDFTILPQWFYPKKGLLTAIDEKQPTWQFYMSPNVSWQLYNSPTAGVGSIDFSYTLIRYWRNNAQNANNAIGIAGGINDYSTRANTLSQLTFSQTFPGNILTISVGQYSLYSIDGTLYDNDQQSGFISYALSQNASATYSLGSVGAYLQFTPTPSINIQAGFQDAYNILGSSFDIYNLTRNRYNFYGYFSWAPQSALGSGQYSALIYSTRKVPEQPMQTTGWSLNFGQHLGEKLYVFGRWNGATGTALNLNRSYVLGLASANPINRNPQDLLGAACSMSKVNPKVVTEKRIRKYETVIETFATIGFGPHISLTPDLQIYIHPARRPDKRSAKVYGIRANFST